MGKVDSIGSGLIRLRQPLDRATNLDTTLITDFFFAFSRFEYALKRAGYVRANDDGYAEANWAAFGRSIRRLYERDRDQNPTFSEAVDYLINNPPTARFTVIDPQDGSRRV